MRVEKTERKETAGVTYILITISVPVREVIEGSDESLQRDAAEFVLRALTPYR